MDSVRGDGRQGDPTRQATDDEREQTWTPKRSARGYAGRRNVGDSSGERGAERLLEGRL